MRRVLRFVSDLHIESMKSFDCEKLRPLWENLNPRTTNYLALLGDIGQPFNLNPFFCRIADHYEKIFFVPGNHEFYNDHVPHYHVEKQLEQLCDKHKIIYLNNHAYQDDDVKFIGTTLWSHIPLDEHKYFKKNSFDYKKIKATASSHITPRMTNFWNKQAVDFIKEHAGDDEESKCVVLTHHDPLPHFSEYVGFYPEPPPINRNAYHNKLAHLIKPPVKLWLHGHTHRNGIGYYNNIHVESNQLGFKSDCVRSFDATREIDLESL